MTYIGFSMWHNGLGIPLSEKEIDIYIERFLTINPNIDSKRLETLRVFLKEDDGDDLIMVNAIKLYDKPLQVPDVSPNETSKEVLGRYNNFVMPFLLKRGSYPVLVGYAVMNSIEVWGIENAKEWTMAGVIRYRSRRDMMEMSTNPEFLKVHKFKIAAMEKTIAFPVTPRFVAGGVEIVAALFLFSVAAFFHLVICILGQKKMRVSV
ncbi:MAG: hypothetical protein JRG81_03030 [Deltaproteobacteria bacterium]|nr:hypothetical protein [Deltaproteobacteria bacterium]